MKKLIIALAAMVSVVTLSSFVIAKHCSHKAEMSDDSYTFYTSVIARSEDTESFTIYISYRAINGGRHYAYTFSDPREIFGALSYYPILKNPMYQSISCKDFRRNYKYQGGTYSPCYFNCNLPYFKE